MTLLTLADPKQDKGVPFEFPTRDPETGRPAVFHIRRVPRSIEIQIEERHEARVQSIRYDKGGQARLTVDSDKQEAIARDKAVYALVSVEGFMGRCTDNVTAALYSRLTGTTINEGESFDFDSRLTEAVKAHLMEEFVELRAWVLGCEGSLGLKVADREAALAKN
jgi:hypothetical protein